MTITRAAWRTPPSREVARWRLSGRRRHNEWRQQQARERRVQVEQALWFYGWDRPGVLGLIADALGVSTSTICRDRQRLRAEWAVWSVVAAPVVDTARDGWR